MKRCNKCGRLLDESEFYMRKSGNRVGDLSSNCKDCIKEKRIDYYQNNKEKVILKTKEWAIKNKDKVKYIKAKHQYGISREEYDSLIRKCQICGSEKNLVIDHFHSTGEIRGMLCQSCNKALGFFKENDELLKKAASYLRGDYSPIYPSGIIYEENEK